MRNLAIGNCHASAGAGYRYFTSTCATNSCYVLTPACYADSCYMYYCAPPGSPHPSGVTTCDAYSNPNPQELQQLLPCAEWGVHGFPSTPGEGWLGDDRLWNLDVGALAARVYFSGSEPSDAAVNRTGKGWAPLPQAGLPDYPGWNRSWVSFEIGPEQMDASGAAVVRWETSEFDVQVAGPGPGRLSTINI